MADFISGKHTKVRFFFNNSPWEVKVKSTRVEELATEITDQVNGESRARFQKIADGFRVTLEVYDDGGASQILQNYIANQANEDANNPQLPGAAGLRFSYLDGTAGGYTLSGGFNLGPLTYNASGRTDRNIATIVFRAQNFAQVPAA